MTRKQLESLWALDWKIEMDKEDLRRLQEGILHPGSSFLAGILNGGSKGDRIPAALARTEALKNRIQEEILQYEEERVTILEFVEDIKDVKIQNIVRGRCVRLYSWRKIASKMRMSEESVKMAYFRWCRKNLDG